MEQSEKVTENIAGYGDVRLEWAYEVQQIRELRIEKRINDHARLYVSGILPEERGDRDIAAPDYGESVDVQQLGEGGAIIRMLFRGQVTIRTIQAVQGIYYFTLEAVSWSYELDVEMKSRSYQPERLSYEDLLDRVLSNYADADYIDTVSGASSLGAFTLQYEETDWTFLKRMASRLGTVLVPEITAASPKLFFGLPVGERWKLDKDVPYRLKKTFRLQEEAHGGRKQASGSKMASTTVYTMESGCGFALGDRVYLPSGSQTVVTEVVSEMKSGLLLHTYQLCVEEDVVRLREENPQAAGVVLSGNVIGVARDRVQLHLDIDEEQAHGDACWFPYVTSYAAEGHSGWYSMPELGDRVQLYLPSAREAEAVVRGSLRQLPIDRKPAEKVWSNKQGKGVSFGSAELELNAGSIMYIRLNEGNGVHIHTPGSLVMSGRNLAFRAGQQLSMQAGEALYLRGGESSLVLDGETDIRSDLLVQEGTMKSPVRVVALAPVPEPPLMTVEAYEAAQTAKNVVGAVQAKGVTGAQIGTMMAAALGLLGMIPVVGTIGTAIAGAALSVLGMVASSGGTGIALAFGKGETLGSLNEEETLQRQMYGELSSLLGKVFTNARGLKDPATKETLVQLLIHANKAMEIAVSKIPKEVREANSRLTKALDFYNTIDRWDPSNRFRVQDIDPKLEVYITDVKHYNAWEDQRLSPEQKNAVAHLIIEKFKDHSDFATNNYFYIVEHTSEAAALAGSISGIKLANRGPNTRPPFKLKDVKVGNKVTEIKVDWKQKKWNVKEGMQGLQESIEQMFNSKLVPVGPHVSTKKSTYKPSAPTETQINFWKQYIESNSGGSLSGSSSGRSKNTNSGEGTPKANGQYSGELVKVPKEDDAADMLAKKLGGESRVKFSNDPNGREFDTVSGQYIAQTKPPLNSLDKQFRKQAKATIEAAIETGRKAYFHFEGKPDDRVLRQLKEYAERYGVEIFIDTKPLKP